ncbi:MAG: 16S rRNA (guanine(527)-N(7))-methyltransferase RsmG [bacterium]|nr:16S rRNA (guanine(527)-N(7))-methyltransferase RsmG [bacterium]
MKDQTSSNQASRSDAPRGSAGALSPAERGALDLGLDAIEPLTPPDGWADKCAQLGIVFEEGELQAHARFLAMLMHANTRMNLTSIRDADEAWEKHIFDSLTLIPLLAELEQGSTVIDIGSGGGLPGIPLAIALPNLRFTLMDATKKKCDYLEQAAAALGLRNVRVICARAETLGQDRGEKTGTGRIDAHREHYDIAMARGVGQIPMLAELTVPLVKVGGLVLMTKGQRAEDELADAKQALHMLHAAHAGTVDTPTGRVVVIEKLRRTPRDYPRRNGEPKRAPLGVSKNR